MTRQKHESWESEREAEPQVRLCPCVAVTSLLRRHAKLSYKMAWE